MSDEKPAVATAPAVRSTPSDELTLSAYAADFNTKFQMAKVLYESRMIPDSIKTPQAVLALVLMGGEYGFSPMKSLELFDYIKGRCAMRVAGLMALCTKHGGRFQTIKEDDTGVTIKGQRLNLSGQVVWEETSTFTIQDAQKARLLEKDNWKFYPKDMCYARAASRLCKRGWPDVIGGLQSFEEMRDADAIDMHPLSNGSFAASVGEEAVRPTENPVAPNFEGRAAFRPPPVFYYDLTNHAMYQDNEDYRTKTSATLAKYGEEVLPNVWRVSKEFPGIAQFAVDEQTVLTGEVKSEENQPANNESSAEEEGPNV